MLTINEQFVINVIKCAFDGFRYTERKSSWSAIR